MKTPANPKIKAVIFDLGNVLVNYDVGKAARRFSKAFKISQFAIWKHFFLSPFERAYTRGEISTMEFFHAACRAFRKPLSYRLFKYYWNDIFWENPGMEKLLIRLKKNYPLYLISNTNPMHYTHLKKGFKLLRHFKRKFPSHEVKARKPELRIYRRVLQKIGYRPEETVFIDDMKSFIRGAKKVGMYTIRFQNLGQLKKELRQLGIGF